MDTTAILAFAKPLMPGLTGIELRYIPNRHIPFAITYQYGDKWSELFMDGGRYPSWWSGTNRGFDGNTLIGHWAVRNKILENKASL